MTWVPTRLDLKALRDWNDVKTSSIGMEEVVLLVEAFLNGDDCRFDGSF